MADPAEARRKSPRAPTMPLDEALERTLKVYEKERLHATSTDIAAKHMGYTSANNGSALQCLASLRYYGLLERPRDGLVAVSKDVEAYKFAPTEDLRAAFLRRFVSAPPLFAELLDRFQGGMPSDESLRYELIQRGFIPSSAATVGIVFRRSVEFAGVLDEPHPITGLANPPAAPAGNPLSFTPPDPSVQEDQRAGSISPGTAATRQFGGESTHSTTGEDAEHDRIPVRLSGGRRAWILVPTLFYARDKERLKAQIDLLLTEDEEDL
jgi:hypothetical protein